MGADFGVIYVATGPKCRQECLQSAISAKSVMPDVPISLWTDKTEDADITCFDEVNILENPKYSPLDKILPLKETSYRKNLYLDTDTFLLHSVYEISNLLERFDLAFSHAPNRLPYYSHIIEEIPICFPELNTGVIAFNKKSKVINLIDEWHNIYTEQLESTSPPKHDQPAFRKALYYSDIRISILPSEYNFRTRAVGFKGANCPVKILHGRGYSLRQAIKGINLHKGEEIYDFRERKLTSKIKNMIKNLLLLKQGRSQ